MCDKWQADLTEDVTCVCQDTTTRATTTTTTWQIGATNLASPSTPPLLLLNQPSLYSVQSLYCVYVHVTKGKEWVLIWQANRDKQHTHTHWETYREKSAQSHLATTTTSGEGFDHDDNDTANDQVDEGRITGRHPSSRLVVAPCQRSRPPPRIRASAPLPRAARMAHGPDLELPPRYVPDYQLKRLRV